MNYNIPRTEAEDNLGEELYKVVSKPLYSLSDSIATKIQNRRSITGPNQELGVISFPEGFLDSIPAGIEGLRDLYEEHNRRKKEEYSINGVDKAQIDDYIRTFLSGKFDSSQKLFKIIEEIYDKIKVSQINMSLDEFGKTIQGRTLINSKGEKVQDEKAYSEYKEYLEYTKYSILREYVSSFFSIGLEMARIIGNIKNVKDVNKTIKQIIIYATLNKIEYYLKDLATADKRRWNDIVIEHMKWKEFYARTEFVSTDEKVDAEANIEETLKIGYTYEIMFMIYEAIISLGINTVKTKIVESIVYQELSDSDVIDSKAIAQSKAQISSKDGMYIAFFNILRRIQKQESIGPSNMHVAEREADIRAYLQQVKEINELKSPKKGFDELIIKKGVIQSPYREWEFYIPKDIKLKRGECVYLDGKSGAGKTTLFRTLVKGAPKLNNIMTVDGEEVDRLYSQTIYFGKGSTLLPKDCSVLTKITGKRKSSKEDREIVSRLLKEVHYPEADLDNDNDVSLGQAERLFLAKVLYRIEKSKKAIVFLDEPIGQVQHELKIELMKLITRISQREKYYCSYYIT